MSLPLVLAILFYYEVQFKIKYMMGGKINTYITETQYIQKVPCINNNEKVNISGKKWLDVTLFSHQSWKLRRTL